VIALVSAAHLFLFSWPGQPAKALFELPSEGESACGIGTLQFGAPDGSWSSGSGGQKVTCEFRQFVEPGALLSQWVDAGKTKPGADVEVTWTLQGGRATGKGHTATLKAEAVAADALHAQSAAGLSGTVTKVKNDSRVELKNAGSSGVLLGDVIAARNKPDDSCIGAGPQVYLQPGETYVDERPGLVSKSMVIWAAIFTTPTQCRWVEARRR